MLQAYPLFSYYQIVTSYRYVYSDNLFDFSDMTDDQESYSLLQARMWWNLENNGGFFKGDLTGGILLYPDDRFFRSHTLFGAGFSYEGREISTDSKVILGNFRSFHFGMKRAGFEAKAGLFPLSLSPLTFDDSMAGVFMSIPAWQSAGGKSFLGVASGVFRYLDVYDRGWILEATPYGFGFPVPNEWMTAIWFDTVSGNVNLKIFYAIDGDLSNYGFDGEFTGKGGKVHAGYSVSEDDRSSGDAFYVKVEIGRKHPLWVSYSESSGYDYLLGENGEQSYYRAIFSAPPGGFIFGGYLRHLSSLSVFSAGGEFSYLQFKFSGAYFYYGVTGYDVPAKILGNEVDVSASLDVGYAFVRLQAGAFVPGKMLELSLDDYASGQELAPPDLRTVSKIVMDAGLRF